MTLKTILTEPNKILREVSKPVSEVGLVERKLMDDMLETMYAANGIGLAAIQIGVLKRIIVVDISKDENKKEPMYFVNPVIHNKNLEKELLFARNVAAAAEYENKNYRENLKPLISHEEF